MPIPPWGAKPGSSGGGAVSSVSNSDGTLTISPTTGSVVGSLALGHANTWTGAQTFNAGELLDKGSQIYNVKAYGATGNGSTDDTTNIQSAITAAQVSGGVVYFPKGTYKVSASLTVGGGSPGAIEIVGDGWNSEIALANASNCYIFDFGTSGSPTYTPGLVMRDLYLNCNGANQTTAGGGIYARGAVHCNFNHLWIDTPWEAGIRFYQDGTGSYGHHNLIDGECYFSNGVNSNGGNGWAIKFEQADENRVIGCTFQFNGVNKGSGQDAQIFDTSAGLQSIIGNAFTGSGSGSVVAFIKSVSNPGRMMIADNAFDTTNNGDFLYLSGTANTITGNSFLGIGNGASSTVYGVNLSLCQYTTVTGNSFYSNGAHAGGISDSGGDYNSFGANTFQGTFVSKVTAAGTHDQVFDDGSGNLTIYSKLTAPSIEITTSPTSGYVLTSDSSGNGTWQVSSSGFSNPMTTLGDIIYENATPAPARLAGITSATMSVLTQTGTGSVSAAPAWTTTTGTGNIVRSTSPTFVTPILGTPTSGVATNLTGTASGLTAGTVTTNANLTGPITSSGNATTITSSVSIPGSPTTTTQAPADNSTKVATTAYVDNAVLGQDFKQAVSLATTGVLATYVYNNGSSGVGATITAVATGVVSFDGTALTLGMRVLVKNETSTNTPNNGIYTVTTAGALGVALILTRATDFDQTTDIDAGDSVFVTSGTTQSTTTWAYNGITGPTMGTTNITFAQTAGQGSFTAGSGVTITGSSIAITAPVTVALGGTNATSASIAAFNNITGYTASGATGTTSTNLVFSTSPSLVTPALGTPASGVMTNVTGTATGLTSGITNALASATTTVNVSSATAPSANQVLTATSSTAATWQTPSSGGGITWAAITTSGTATINTGSITNSASLITVTLPSTAAVGSIVEVAGLGTGGWKVAQAASVVINYGSAVTTTGTGGSLASTNQWDAVRLLCVTANVGWSVLSSVGNLTVT